MFGSPSLSGRSELISSIKVAIMAEITEAVIKTIVKEPENKRVANWMQATQAKAPALWAEAHTAKTTPRCFLENQRLISRWQAGAPIAWVKEIKSIKNKMT